MRIRRERSGVWILNVVILAFLAFAAPNFFSLGNIEAVLNDTAILGIGAAGMTVLIIAGAFDLSVTAIMGLAPIVALASAGTASGLLIVLVSIATGAVLGLVNGLIITRGRVAPFVATLGTLFVFGSIGAIVSNGNALDRHQPARAAARQRRRVRCAAVQLPHHAVRVRAVPRPAAAAAYRPLGARGRAATCAPRMSAASTCAGSISASSCCPAR